MNKSLVILSFSAVLLIGCSDTTREVGTRSTEPDRDPVADSTVAPGTPADNTGVNVRDQQDTLTPLDQGQTQPDLDITQKIRQAVVKDDSLSINAHNVKIITLNGAVTLRGPVKSADEKAAVVAKAVEIAGAQHVNDQLEVAP